MFLKGFLILLLQGMLAAHSFAQAVTRLANPELSVLQKARQLGPVNPEKKFALPYG